MADSRSTHHPELSTPVVPPSDDLKGLVEQSYNTIALQYLEWTTSSKSTSTSTRLRYLHKLSTAIPVDSKILDLGCGAGVPCTQFLVAQGHDVTAVDISAAQIALAQKHVPKAKRLIHGDMMALECPLGSFDAVVAFYSVIHLPKREQGVLMRKIQGWLVGGSGLFLGNFVVAEGDSVEKDWLEPGADMFWSGFGVEGTREMFRREAPGLEVLMDEVVVEKVGSGEERFHWVTARKREELGIGNGSEPES
jgi:SAM-dependent methyltransferase